MTRRPSQAGFTLLETLVALTILGFILAGLAAGTQLGFAASSAQARAEAQRQDLQPVDLLLRRLVAGISLPDDPQLAGLVGDRTGFVCVTQDPAAAIQPPPRIDAVIAADAANDLVLRYTPHIHAERLLPRPAPTQDILLQGLQRLEVSYLSPDRTGWLPDWTRTDLPALIRIRLVFPPGDPRRWPPIVAATRQTRINPATNG